MLRVLLAAVAGVALGPSLSKIISAYSRPPATALVGATAAGAFALLAVKVTAPLALAGFCWVAGAGVALGYVDAARHRLPDRLTAPALAGALAFLGSDALVAGRPAALCPAVLSGLAVGGFYALLVLLNPTGMGAGDAKLAVSVGTVLGWLGYPVAFLGVLAGFALAAAYAAFLVGRGRISRRGRLAHGPFMLLGALLAIVGAG
ncbi:prepilin peptidase [Planosporangium thailandense]|uniref:Prepilin peptidase n=1 Tax=Planosporangium thailandense TaxID=765197 RepID=A0ABX0XUA2_9ACTN|nr:A24 family peptidase [Planosporangium thailandense]NJC68874.1 prepilin peptidase [Planosporangium thailandense]